MIIKSKYISILFFAFYLFLDTIAIGQDLPQKEVEKAITTMARLIEENYVFKDKSKAIAAHLQEQFKQGKYKGVSDWKTFGSLSSHILQTFSQDGHIYTAYDPKMVRELKMPVKAAENGNKPEGEDPFFYSEDAKERNFGFSEVKILEGNIGYIKLTEINISEKSLPILFSAMQFVANTKALIVDLQENGGGGNAVGNVFESYFLPKHTPLLDIKTRHWGDSKAQTVAWLTEKKYDKPLYILTSKRTFSAAEALAYSLQRHKRAIIVGQTSGGGAHMNSWYPVNEWIYISVSTGAPTWPGTQENWEGKGVKPDHLTAKGEELKIVKQLVDKFNLTQKEK